MNVWDGLTNAMYSTHKLLGFLLLWLVAGRLLYRLLKGAPPDEPSLRPLGEAASRMRCTGCSTGCCWSCRCSAGSASRSIPSLTLFGLFDLPALAAPNQELAPSGCSMFTASLARVLMVLAARISRLRCSIISCARTACCRRMLPGLRRRR